MIIMNAACYGGGVDKGKGNDDIGDSLEMNDFF